MFLLFAAIRPFYVYPTTAPAAGGTIRVQHNNSTTTTLISPTPITDTGGPIRLRHEANWVVSNVSLTGTPQFAIYAGGTSGTDGLGTIGNVNDLRLMLVGSVVGNHGTNALTSGVYLANRTGVSLANLTNTFYIGSVNTTVTPLPVELLFFNASPQHNKVLLTWSTATETNNSFFTLERSRDGRTFESVGQVNGAGTINTKQEYQFIDHYPYLERSYYRLSQTDFDGTTKYFSVITVELNSSAFAFRVYPNPTSREFDIEINAEDDGKAFHISLSDMTGKSFIEIPVNAISTACQLLHVTLPDTLKAGVYLVKVQSSNRSLVQKLVVY